MKDTKPKGHRTGIADIPSAIANSKRPWIGLLALGLILSTVMFVSWQTGPVPVGISAIGGALWKRFVP
ncbi:hypothetical protein U1839_01155 [Sphingomonas sp. RT2P30]|uniref:hypothetical protein n=1 Tax=Parasphingomonas halimpatiens TaxID=3096162 RepID=UPI002FC6CDA2